MSLVKRGLLTQGHVIRVSAPSMSVDDAGLMTLEETWECDASILFSVLPKINQSHSEFPFLVCKGYFPELLPASKARWSATYRGLPRGIDDALPDPIWTVDTVASQEDIQTHWNFDVLRQIAEDADGYQEDPETGIFIGFTEPESLRGVSQFLAPTVSLSVSRWGVGTPNGGRDVGKIDWPDTPLATQNSSGDQNWLKIGCNATQYGEFWQVQESWLRSGPKGWNPDIYEEA
jgi:hypothetical protein